MEPKFIVREKIGTGGMAEVFRAEITGPGGFSKTVAIKRLKPWLTDDKQLIEMFVDEARILSGLTHPNIVQVHNFGRSGKEYLLVMEYVHGRSLAQLMDHFLADGGRVAFSLMAHVAAQTARGLAYAHEKRDLDGRPLKIVHRDISPDNILLSADGQVKVVDFGIAKAADRTTRTAMGQVKGKFFYMAPERLRNQEVDARTDLFSLGLVIHEMVSGERIFERPSEQEVYERIKSWKGLPRRKRPKDFPAGLWEITLRALKPTPRDRFQSSAEMAEALERFHKEVSTRPGDQELSEVLRNAFPKLVTSSLEEATDPQAPGPPTREVTVPEPAMLGHREESDTSPAAPPTVDKKVGGLPSLDVGDAEEDDEQATVVVGQDWRPPGMIREAGPGEVAPLLPILEDPSGEITDPLHSKGELEEAPGQDLEDLELHRRTAPMGKPNLEIQRNKQATMLKRGGQRLGQNPDEDESSPWLWVLVFVFMAVITIAGLYLID